VALDAQRGMFLERKIPLVTIKSFAMSNLRDDWLVSLVFNMCYYLLLTCRKTITGNASEEGDPIISCVFKTELITQLIILTRSNANLLIGPT
jgi:myosin-1